MSDLNHLSRVEREEKLTEAQLTEAQLLTRIQHGDRQAIIITYERYFAALYRYVRLRVDSSQTAEDIVSEVFVTLLESINMPHAPRQHLRGWLYQVARSKLSAQSATTASRTHLVDWNTLEEWMPNDTLIVSENGDPEALLGDVYDRQRLYHALRMLNPDHQEVLLLRFGEHLSLRETADVLGKNISAIKSIQFRALQTLRQIMSQPQEGGELWQTKTRPSTRE